MGDYMTKRNAPPPVDDDESEAAEPAPAPARGRKRGRVAPPGASTPQWKKIAAAMAPKK